VPGAVLASTNCSQPKSKVDEVVAAVTASFHQREMTSEEAVSYCIENVPMQELARVYKLLTEE